jgi:hypothetical protein
MTTCAYQDRPGTSLAPCVDIYDSTTSTLLGQYCFLCPTFVRVHAQFYRENDSVDADLLKRNALIASLAHWRYAPVQMLSAR